MQNRKWEPNDLDTKNAEKLGGLLTQAQLADYFGVTVSQLRGAFDRHEEFRKAYDKGRAASIAQVAKNLVQKAMAGNVACMIFYLKAQANWSEKSIMQHESVGDGGSAETADAARRDVLGRLAGIAKRLEKEGGAGGADGRGPEELEGAEVRLDVLGEAGSISA